MKCSLCNQEKPATTAVWSLSGVAICLDCIVSLSGEPSHSTLFGLPVLKVLMLPAWNLDIEWLRRRAREQPRRVNGWITTHMLFGSESTFISAQSDEGRRVVAASSVGWVPSRFNATPDELAKTSKARW